MTSTTLTIKTDKKLRDAAKRTAKRLGIPLTTVVNAQLKQFVAEGRFEVSLAPRPEKIREWEAISREFEEHPEQFTFTDDIDTLIRDLGLA
jgi:antitoxin component of RelBE/YafQ-DinJ toxin-antitoxin module